MGYQYHALQPQYILILNWLCHLLQKKFLSHCCLQALPGPLKITPDQIEILKKNDNVVSGEYPTLKDLGITGTPIQSILPKVLQRFRTGGEFNK